MAATTADIATTYSGVHQISVKVAADAVIPVGTMVSVNASGYAIPAANTSASNDVIGIARDRVDATGASDGDKEVIVMRHNRFKIKNSGTAALTQAHMFKPALVADNQTVAATASESNKAGTLVGIDNGYCWVEIPG